MSNFKKTTKTDKSKAISSRIKWLQDNIKTPEELYNLLESTSSDASMKAFLVKGRSLHSLFGPLYGIQNRHQFHFNFRNCIIDETNEGARIAGNASYNLEILLYIIGKIWKISEINVSINQNLIPVLVYDITLDMPCTKPEVKFSKTFKNKLDNLTKLKNEKQKEYDVLSVEYNKISKAYHKTRTEMYDAQREFHKAQSELSKLTSSLPRDLKGSI